MRRPCRLCSKPPWSRHALVEGVFAGVAERRMAEVVRQGDGLGQVFVEAELAGDGAADLGHFQGVRQAGAVVVVGLGDEHLRLVHQPAKGGGVDDAVAVALVEGAVGVLRLGMTPAAAVAGAHGIGGEHFFFAVNPVGAARIAYRRT